MPSKNNKILEFDKSHEAPFIIYGDLPYGCKNNPEKLSTKTEGEHTLSGFFSVYNILI